MKDRKLKKYREWFKCPHLVEERDCVTTDPHPTYQETTYCKLGRYSCSGYSGYPHSEEGTPCEKCKLPINRKLMHEALMTGKKYKKIFKTYDNAYKRVRKIYTTEPALFDTDKNRVIETIDETDPNYEKLFLKAEYIMDKFWNDWRNR